MPRAQRTRTQRMMPRIHAVWLSLIVALATAAAGGPAATVGVGSPRDANPPISRNDPLFREFLDWRASRQKAVQ